MRILTYDDKAVTFQGLIDHETKSIGVVLLALYSKSASPEFESWSVNKRYHVAWVAKSSSADHGSVIPT